VKNRKILSLKKTQRPTLPVYVGGSKPKEPDVNLQRPDRSRKKDREVSFSPLTQFARKQNVTQKGNDSQKGASETLEGRGLGVGGALKSRAPNIKN